MGQYECSSRYLLGYKSILLLFWATIVVQTIYSSIRYTVDRSQSSTSKYRQQNSKSTALDIIDINAPNEKYLHSRSTSSNSVINFEAHLGAELYQQRPFGLLFAEAGKKKKKSKSEVVVISVQNPPSKGSMYPVFIPSCGGHHGGHYGRRKRAIPGLRR